MVAHEVPESVLELVVKLLNVTVEKGATEAEAATAASKASALLLKHQLEMADVEAVAGRVNGKHIEGEKPTHGIVSIAEMEHIRWQQTLLYALCHLNFCKGLQYGMTGRMVIIGSRENIAVVTALFDYVKEQILTLIKQARKAALADPSSDIRSLKPYIWNKSFAQGVIARLSQRMQQERVEMGRATAVTAIVVAHDAANQAYMEEEFAPGKSRGGSGMTSREAWGRGVRMGNAVSTRGVGGSGSSRKRIA